MSYQNKKQYLRETMAPTPTQIFNEDTNSYYARQDQSDRSQNVRKKFSPHRPTQRKQSLLIKSKLRSTYSPVTLSARFETDFSNLDYLNNYNSQSTSRFVGLGSTHLKPKHKASDSSDTSSFTSLHNKLTYLEQCVNKAKKQLEDKNSKKNKIQQSIPKIQAIHETRANLFRKDRHLIVQTSDLKATIKIPELSSLVAMFPKPKQAVGFDTDPYSPRNHNTYYVSQLIRAVGEKNSLAKQHIRSSIKILKTLESIEIPSFQEIEERKLNLKKDQRHKDKKTIVFDLDETLIHCNQNPEMTSDVKLLVKLQNGQFIAGINIRPHALAMLAELAKKFQLMIFTASHSSYANVVLDYLDPENKLFQHRLYREHCFQTANGMYVKDLRIINRNPSQLVLVDNAAYSYAFQLENGVPILNYYEGEDFQLKALVKYLQKLTTTKDVRQINKKTFKLHHYTKFNTPEELIEQLYMEN